MRFKLVLTGNERHAELTRFFSSIEQQTSNDRTEIAFVNQGDFRIPDSLRFPDTVSLKTYEMNSPMPLSRARNIALVNLDGDIIAFPDDDCWYPPDLLKDVSDYFASNEKVDCVCTCVFDPERNISYGSRPLNTKREINYSNLFQLPSSVGIFVRRSALQDAGAYFDERLGAGTRLGSGEEIELIARLLACGKNVQYNGFLSVFHPVCDYVQTDIKKYFQYGLGFGFLNGRLIAQGRRKVMLYFLEITMRSVVGIFVNLLVDMKRQIYVFRLKGIIAGFLEGFRAS